MKPGDAFFFGFLLGLFVTVIIAALVRSNADDRWRVAIVGHGYAHYDKASTWHWNDEK